MQHDDPLADKAFGHQYELAPKAAEQAQRRLLEIAQEVEFRKKLSSTFGTEQGLDVLEWMLEAMRLHATAFTGNAYTNYNCALKDFAGQLFDLVMHANPVLACRLIQRRFERGNAERVETQKQLEEAIRQEERRL